MELEKLNEFLINNISGEDHANILSYSLFRSDEKDNASPYVVYLVQKYILPNDRFKNRPFSLYIWCNSLGRVAADLLDREDGFSLEQLVMTSYEVSVRTCEKLGDNETSQLKTTLRELCQFLFKEFPSIKIKKISNQYKNEKPLSKVTKKLGSSDLKKLCKILSPPELEVVTDIMLSSYNIFVDKQVETDILEWLSFPIDESRLSKGPQSTLFQNVVLAFPTNNINMNPYNLVWLWKKAHGHFSSIKKHYKKKNIQHNKINSFTQKTMRENKEIFTGGAHGFIKAVAFTNELQTGEERWIKSNKSY